MRNLPETSADRNPFLTYAERAPSLLGDIDDPAAENEDRLRPPLGVLALLGMLRVDDEEIVVEPPPRTLPAAIASKRSTLTLPSAETTTPLDAALWYAGQGLRVFPLQARKKIPFANEWHGLNEQATGGFHVATTDPVVIRRWWRRAPGANIGAPADTFWVLDIDKKIDATGKVTVDGLAALAEIEAKHGTLPPTLQQLTGNGGQFLFLRGDQIVPNTEGAIGDGIDTRGSMEDGSPAGYVLLPPSVHPNGKPYRWTANGAKAGTFSDLLHSAPDWLVKLAKQSKKTAESKQGTKTLRNDQTLQPTAADSIPFLNVTMVSDLYMRAGIEGELETLAAGTTDGQQEVTINGCFLKLAGMIKGWGLNETDIRERAFGIVRNFPLHRPREPWTETLLMKKWHHAMVDATPRELPTTERTDADEHVAKSNVLSDADATAPAFSDEALALEFADEHKHDLRYVAQWGHWYRYEGTCWREDSTLQAYELARKVCRAAARCCNKKSEAKSVASAKTVTAVERLAKADRRLAATVEQWDSDPMLLNTPSGVVDLKTSFMRAHRYEDYFTRLTAIAPDKACPTPIWNAFLSKIFNGDGELIRYMARVCGYGLTGVTKEDALFFGWGKGANGKTTLLNTIAGIMGNYHELAPMELFMDNKHQQHPTGLAGLHQARLVTANETEEGRTWNESLIKSLTGGESGIKARFMRQDYFTFEPRFKLFIAGNKKPSLKSVDVSIRRRLHLIPFTKQIPASEQDLDLVEKLKAEWPGILAWMIDGCVEWQRGGLRQPKAVLDATNIYLEEEDAVGSWIDECCDHDPTYVASALDSELWCSYREWCQEAGVFAGLRKSFLQALEARGCFCHPGRGQGRRHRGLTIKLRRQREGDKVPQPDSGDLKF